MTSMRKALRARLAHHLAHDPDVLLLGEDLSSGSAFGVTEGLAQEFGVDRVMDMPISESAFVGMAVGAAMTGLKPVVEIMFADFLTVAMDPIVNQAAKWAFLTGTSARPAAGEGGFDERADTPAPSLVIRCAFGAGDRSGVHHSQSLVGLLAAVPGLTVLVPSGPSDAAMAVDYGLSGHGPVILFEHKALYDAEDTACVRETVSDPLILRDGSSLALLAIGNMLAPARSAVSHLERQGVDVRLISLMDVSLTDPSALHAAIGPCRDILVVDEAPGPLGYGAQLAGALMSLMPGKRALPVQSAGSPVPYAPALEDAWLAGVDDIMTAAIRLQGQA